jgi:hypothetical protein
MTGTLIAQSRVNLFRDVISTHNRQDSAQAADSTKGAYSNRLVQIDLDGGIYMFVGISSRQQIIHVCVLP